MILKEILHSVDIISTNGQDENFDILGVSIDSREVKNGYAFFAISGFKTDGTKYIKEALKNGAIAVIHQSDDESIINSITDKGVIAIKVENVRKALAQFSIKFYNDPSAKLTLIGITGTKGKTTTSYYLKSIFETSGIKTGLIGTNKNMIGNHEIPTALTTPESHVVNGLMAQMVKEGCTHCIMEVSSHALDLYRVYGLQFNCALFTNLTSDHMDFHQTRTNYLQAKKKLFDMLDDNAVSVMNGDDIACNELTESSKSKVITYGISENSNYKISNIKFNFESTCCSVENNNKITELSTKLLGKFNIMNFVGAFSASIELGLEEDLVIEGIKNTKQIAGRFEVISKNKKKVIIDFSHTADSLQKALESINEISNRVTPRPEIITVFGCGGNRDKSKRPEMGRIASEYSDLAVVTSDNPRDEDPNIIINDIIAGIAKDNYEVYANREEAIKFAIDKASENSVILIAGKGHENYQLVKGVKSHFSDKEIAEKYLV